MGPRSRASIGARVRPVFFFFINRKAVGIKSEESWKKNGKGRGTTVFYELHRRIFQCCHGASEIIKCTIDRGQEGQQFSQERSMTRLGVRVYEYAFRYVHTVDMLFPDNVVVQKKTWKTCYWF